MHMLVPLWTISNQACLQLPGEAAGNHVMQVDADTGSFAGFVHLFENTALDAFMPQDCSATDGVSFWLYGLNSGMDLFIDILDNRSSGASSTTDDAERFTSFFVDDFSGWELVSLPYTSFARKGVFPTAPNDGLGLTEVNGWAFGTLATGGPVTYFIDDFGLVPEPATLTLFALGVLGLGFSRRKKA